jgi:hypothetical protein
MYALATAYHNIHNSEIVGTGILMENVMQTGPQPDRTHPKQQKKEPRSEERGSQK